MRKERSKLRVGSGRSRGTVLELAEGVRPMPSRMKHALFNILGTSIVDSAILDLFAGTGSIGIEAASRGAASALLVEKDRAISAITESNIVRAGLDGICKVMSADVYSLPQLLKIHDVPYSVVFLDPPYVQSRDPERLTDLMQVIQRLTETGAVARSAVVVVHAPAGSVDTSSLPGFLGDIDARCYGTGALIICRLKKKSCT